MMDSTHSSIGILIGSGGLYGLYKATNEPSTYGFVNTLSDWVLRTTEIPIHTVGELSFTGFFVASLLVIALASIFPDIDRSTAPLGRIFPFVEMAIGHRTWTHSIWAVLLLGAITVAFNSFWLGLFTAFYFLHLLIDSRSLSGNNWFYPIERRPKSRFLRYRVRGPFEFAISLICGIANIYLIYVWIQLLDLNIFVPVFEWVTNLF